MKALEKAAQERNQGNPGKATLALEPLSKTARAAENKERVTATPAPRPALGADAQARAASVLAAGEYQSATSSLVAWFITRPVFAFGALAMLFLLFYGAYVYVQIAHPGLLARTPPRSAAQPISTAPPAQPAQTTQPAQAGTTTTSETEAATESTPAREPSPTTTPVPTAGSPTVPATTASTNSGMIARTPAPLAAAPSQSVTASAAAAPVPLTQQQRVAISRADDTQPRVNPAVARAWTALQAGEYDNARQLYDQVLRAEPANIDAHLGLAAIAQSDGRVADAQRHYAAILQADPRNSLAQNGLIALGGRNDPQGAETRLKLLISREPSAPLYFSLGNVYAEQGQWRDAQQAYFQAHHLDAQNPDYAYNLAVGLEHLAQPRIALDYYRKAATLAATRGSANFDMERVKQRIGQLSGTPK